MQPPYSGSLKSGAPPFHQLQESDSSRQESDVPPSGFTGHRPPSPDGVQDNSGPLLKKLKKEECLWNLKAVLDQAVTWDIPQVQVISAQVSDVKQTSALVKKLNEVLPLPSLQHLKRVKSFKTDNNKPVIHIIVCLASSCDNVDTLGPYLTSLGVDTSALTPSFTTSLVASTPPFTRLQFNQLRSVQDYWPCHFHEDKYLESLVNGTHELWSKDNKEKQEKYMERAREVGGGVVVDPTSDTVIAAAHGTVHLHPLHHGVMNLVDLVARSQGGGASPHTAGVPTFFYKCTEPSDLSHGDGASPGVDTQGCDAPSGGFYNLLKRYGSIGQLSEVPKTGPYLCTGYDVYLLREPCAMCAMALLHMRTRRVFYSLPSKDGVLGSNGTIHTLEGLNHRYEVFCNILNEDPSRAATEFCT